VAADSGTSRAPVSYAQEKEEGEVRMGWRGSSAMAAARGSLAKVGRGGVARSNSGGGTRGFRPVT
jgi:hypothetical protein